LGHLYPVFLRFQGGKGVATAAGVLLAFEPWLGLAVLAAWVLTLVGLRYSSLAAIVAALSAPLLYWLGGAITLWQVQPAVGIAITAMSALLLWRHSGNIQRLLAGQESKVGSKKT
ncbi:MAG: glycerol-3-phosphate acyltransferase, partial [Serpentinimonas sp.]|nr:glycerol-3-phosphate acyltransferase [Serpentinimonas sp.]